MNTQREYELGIGMCSPTPPAPRHPRAFLDTLSSLLQEERDRRLSRLFTRSLKLSGSNEALALADLGRQLNPKLLYAACFELLTPKSLRAWAKALIVDKHGTGNSHVSKDAAYQVTLQGLDLLSDSSPMPLGMASTLRLPRATPFGNKGLES